MASSQTVSRQAQPAGGTGVVPRVSDASLAPRGDVRGDARAPLVFVVVGHLDQLEGVPVGVLEVDPAPAGEDALVDDVHVAVELDALRLELGLRRLDVVDDE